MKPPVCDSVFDVVFWLLDRALEDGEYLQPQKMQRLMYLAQAYWGAVSRGQRLMPCVFVTSALGPVEPTSWRVLEQGRPFIDHKKPNSQVSHFLDSLWRRFGAHTPEYLTKLVMSHPPYKDALEVGPRAEVTLEAMIAYYGRRPGAEEPSTEAPPLDAVLRPRVMRSHKGKPVSVHRWVPKRRVSTTPEGSSGT